MPFPLAKLAYMAIRQMAKPVAAAIKRKAKTTPFLRNYILLPPANLYHKFDTTFKLRILGLGKVKKVKPMTEEAAIDLASDMLGETIIFTVGAGCIYLEYLRQMHKDRNKEDFQNLRLNELETRVQDLGLLVEEQSAQIREMTRTLVAQSTPSATRGRSGSTASGSMPSTIRDINTGTVLVVDRR